MHLFTLAKHTSLFIFGLLLCSVVSLRAAVWNMPTAPVQQAQVNVQDGDLITDDGGQAGAYSSLYRGALTLVPPPGMIVRLEFLSFNLETDFDNLAAFDGPNSLHPLLLCQTSGSALPPVLTGTRTEGLTLFMTSDGSDEREGFVARVVLLPAGAPPGPLTDFNIAALGHETLTVCGGTLYDQGGLGCDYLHNAGYQYDNNGFPVPDGFTTLVPDQPGHVIRIEFQDFAFETLTSEDDLWIFDGNDDQAPLIGEYRVNPGIITADNGLAPNPDGSLTLWMVSDFIFNAAGFRARISCVPRPDAVISGSQTICNGETASLTVDLSGTPPFSFSYTDNGQAVEVTNWNLPQFTFDVTPGIGDHVYEIVSVADANLTQLRAPLTPSNAVVTVIAGPTANFAAPQYQTCGGNPVTVRINLTGVAPYSFSYSDGTNVFDVNGHNSGQFEFTVSPASSTTYQLLSVSDAQCSTGRIVQDQTLVVVSPPPAATLVGASAAGVCPGGSADLVVELTGSGPWNLTYTDGAQQYTVNGVANSPLRIPVTPAAVTDYSLVSVTTANCPPGQVAGQTQLVIFPEPAIDVSTSVSCDDGTGTITLNGSGGTAPYLYSFDGGLVWGQANSAKRPPSPNPYPVAVRDANGCRKDATALVQGLPAPRITDFLAITQTSMAVVWTSVPGVGVYYSLRYRIAGSAMPWIVIPFVFDTKRMVGGLQSNTRYEFQVKVICGGGLESDWSEIEEETTLPGDPADCSLAVRAPWPMPGSFYYDQLTSRSVRLNWGSVAGPGYIVAWGKAQVNPNNWPQDVVCNLNPLPATTSYIIQGLSPGTTYRARVRTNCSNCTSALQSTDRRSAWTQVIEFTTPITREDAATSMDEAWPQLSLYPNPNDGRFTVTGLDAESFSTVNWRVLDLKGRILIEGVGQIDGDSAELQFDLSEQPAGLYLLELVSGSRKHHIKVWIR